MIEALSTAGPAIAISAANYVETAIVVDMNDQPELSARLQLVLDYWSIEVVPVTAEQAALARDAYRDFGKGRHPARLNFGDCFAYALAVATGRPLLFKGEDFARTDVTAAI